MIGKVIVLGIVQGLTEFLPVSSTGHLIVLERLFGFSESEFGILFDVMLHGGTLLALVVYFWTDLVKIGRDLIGNYRKNGRLPALLLVGTVPGVLVGVFFEGFISGNLRNSIVVGACLILFSGVFYLGERVSKKNKEIGKLSLVDGVVIGLFQAVALVPGVSRSGITITGGLFRNLKREEAGRFAFLLSIPIVLGAFLAKSLVLVEGGNGVEFMCYSLIGFLASFLTGVLVIRFFMKYLKKHNMDVFLVYRVILGLLILLLL